MSEERTLRNFFGKTTFCKVKSALEIDKMLLSFVDTADAKNKHIECYIDAVDFGMLMEQVADGRFGQKLTTEKAKGAQYPGAVFTSNYGGCKTPDGKAISRYFTIAPGSKQDLVLTAYAYPAHVDEMGKYVPDKGAQASCLIRVGCTWHDFDAMRYCWKFLEGDYMRKKYNVEALKNSFEKA